MLKRPLITLLVVGLVAAGAPFVDATPLSEAPPAEAQGTDPCAGVSALWCAELTVTDQYNQPASTTSYRGCREKSGRWCASALTDDNFTFAGADFYVGRIANSPGPSLYLVFYVDDYDTGTGNPRNSKGVLDPLHLCVGTSSFSFATAGYASGDNLPTWSGHSLGRWMVNDKVLMKIGWGASCSATPPPHTVSLPAGPNPAPEGDPVTVRATLNRSHTADLVVPLTLRSGTAESGDYGTLTSITIPSGSLSGTGTVMTSADADAADETFTVALGTLPAGLNAGRSSVTVRILESGSTCMPDWCAVLTAGDLSQHQGNPGYVGCDSRTLIIDNTSTQADRNRVEGIRNDVWCSRRLTHHSSPLGNIEEVIIGDSSYAGQLRLKFSCCVSVADLGRYTLFVNGVAYDLASASSLAGGKFAVPGFAVVWTPGQKAGLRLERTRLKISTASGGPTVTPAGRSSVAVEWPEAAGATGYEVAYKLLDRQDRSPSEDADCSNNVDPSTAGGWVIRRVGTTTRTTIGGLAQGLVYKVQVRAVDAARKGSWIPCGFGAPGDRPYSGPATPLRLLSASPASISEGSAQQVTITLRLAQAAPTGGLTVNLNASGSAEVTQDFTWTPRITVRANERSGMTTLSVVNDSTHETAESVIVRVDNASHNEFYPSSGAAVYQIEPLRITITDDDAAPAVSGSSAEPNTFHTDPAVQKMAEQIAACADAIKTQVDAWLKGTGSEQAVRNAQSSAAACQFN